MRIPFKKDPIESDQRARFATNVFDLVSVHGFRGSGFTGNLNSGIASPERSCTEIQREVYLLLDQA